jgi:hypothetical protein
VPISLVGHDEELSIWEDAFLDFRNTEYIVNVTNSLIPVKSGVFLSFFIVIAYEFNNQSILIRSYQCDLLRFVHYKYIWGLAECESKLLLQAQNNYYRAFIGPLIFEVIKVNVDVVDQEDRGLWFAFPVLELEFCGDVWQFRRQNIATFFVVLNHSDVFLSFVQNFINEQPLNFACPFYWADASQNSQEVLVDMGVNLIWYFHVQNPWLLHHLVKFTKSVSFLKFSQWQLKLILFDIVFVIENIDHPFEVSLAIKFDGVTAWNTECFGPV